MARTTINLEDEIFNKLKNIAKKENRSTPNLIETILIRHLNEAYFADEAEMEEILADKSLKKSIKKSLLEYSKKQGKFV